MGHCSCLGTLMTLQRRDSAFEMPTQVRGDLKTEEKLRFVSIPAPAAISVTQNKNTPPDLWGIVMHVLESDGAHLHRTPPDGPQCVASLWDRYAERIEVPRVDHDKLTSDQLVAAKSLLCAATPAPAMCYCDTQAGEALSGNTTQRRLVILA